MTSAAWPGRPWRADVAVSEPGVRLFPRNIAVEASYVCYYALAFFVLRWWRMTSRRRPHRFSFAPILGAGFWGAVLLLLIRPPHQPWPGLAALVLMVAAAIVQLVSPWEVPPPAPARHRASRNMSGAASHSSPFTEKYTSAAMPIPRRNARCCASVNRFMSFSSSM